MANGYTSVSPESFDELYTYMKTFPTPLLPPGKPHDLAITDRISSLYVHPTLEALLHILNLDLPSAHFLVRHMQAPPAWEGMYIHGLLHRVEGDYNNCRAWYSNVCGADAFVSFFGSSDSDMPSALSFLSSLPANERQTLSGTLDEDSLASLNTKAGEPRMMHTDAGDKVPSQASARCFISAIEALKKKRLSSTSTYAAWKAELEAASRAEIEALIRFCADKYGTGQVRDATKVWVKPSEEHRAMGEDMVSGGEGWRKF